MHDHPQLITLKDIDLTWRRPCIIILLLRKYKKHPENDLQVLWFFLLNPRLLTPPIATLSYSEFMLINGIRAA